MKRIFAAAVFALLAATTPARAALVDYTATDTPGNIYTLTGTIAPDTTATFEYSIIPGATSTVPGGIAADIGTLVPSQVTLAPFSIGTAELDCNLYTHGCFSNRQAVSYYLPNGTNTVNPVPIPLTQYYLQRHKQLTWRRNICQRQLTICAL